VWEGTSYWKELWRVGAVFRCLKSECVAKSPLSVVPRVSSSRFVWPLTVLSLSESVKLASCGKARLP